MWEVEGRNLIWRAESIFHLQLAKCHKSILTPRGVDDPTFTPAQSEDTVTWSFCYVVRKCMYIIIIICQQSLIWSKICLFIYFIEHFNSRQVKIRFYSIIMEKSNHTHHSRLVRKESVLLDCQEIEWNNSVLFWEESSFWKRYWSKSKGGLVDFRA